VSEQAQWCTILRVGELMAFVTRMEARYRDGLLRGMDELAAMDVPERFLPWAGTGAAGERYYELQWDLRLHVGEVMIERPRPFQDH
jgi:hypothetical protein